MSFFSIIVVALNAEKVINETIHSILCQSFKDFEIVVKDGDSSDNTLSQIPTDDRIKVISKPDHGVYEGMNQGIVEATGEYICFMNCGDCFFDSNVLKNVYDAIRKYEKNGIFYGNYETKGHFTQSPLKTTRASIYRNPLCHQTMFIYKKLFDEYGLYKENFKILADYEFTVHCINEKVLCNNLGFTICKYLGDGISTQKKYRKVYNEEEKWIKKEYFSSLERLKYDIRLLFTMPHFRRYLASEESPELLRRIYWCVANKVKAKI